MPFFNSREHEKDIPSNSGYIPTTVIASFNLEGNIRPLYFSVEIENERKQIKIDQVLSSEKNSFFGMKYTCTFTNNDRQQVIRLYYFYDTCQWKLQM